MMEWLKPGVKVFIKGPRNDYVGEFVGLTGPRTVELKKAVWIADCGRYLSNFMADGKAEGMEVEPVGKGSFAFDDIMEWPHKLFTSRE